MRTVWFICLTIGSWSGKLTGDDDADEEARSPDYNIDHYVKQDDGDDDIHLISTSPDDGYVKQDDGNGDDDDLWCDHTECT